MGSFLWEGRSVGRSTTRSLLSLCTDVPSPQKPFFEGEGRLLKQASHFAYRKLLGIKNVQLVSKKLS